MKSEDEVEKVWSELRRDIDPARIIVVHLTKDFNGTGSQIRARFLGYNTKQQNSSHLMLAFVV